MTPSVLCFAQKVQGTFPTENVDLNVASPSPKVAILGVPLWYALVVAPKHEALSSKLLEANGHETYLPLHTPRLDQTPRRQRARSCECGTCGSCRSRASHFRSRGRKELPERPLFPGYLFCRFKYLDKALITSTLGVIDVVQFGPVPISVPECDLARLRNMIASGVPLEVVRLPIVPHKGQRVEVCEGPMSGRRGVVREVRRNSEVSVDIEPIGWRITVRVDQVEEVPVPAARQRAAAFA